MELLALTDDNYFDNYILYLGLPGYTLYSKGGKIPNADQEKKSDEKGEEKVSYRQLNLSNKTT
jgi:hypothetical protein